mgnify:CR=1 FL=1
MTNKEVRDNFVQDLAENAYLNMCSMEEMKIAIEALEKQIPKKVILGSDEQDYVCCPQCKSEIAPMDDDCLLYHCPGCGEKDAILQGDRYCFNCGQALDWSDTE